MKNITTDSLRRMKGCEGLILQGCGGDPREWIDGINGLLTEEKILLDGSRFQAENVAAFEMAGHTDLLFPFEGVKLDMGRLAIWRLQTNGKLGSTWLSDFVSNRLGGFTEVVEPEKQKPDCPLIGADGNVFNLIGLASRTLRKNGLADEAKEMQGRIMGSECHSYDEALCIIGEYVNITSGEDYDEDMGGMRL